MRILSPSDMPPPGVNVLMPGHGAPIGMRCEIRSGCSIANLMPVIPPIELPTIAAFSMPSSSSARTSASTWSRSPVGSSSSVSPQPGMSNAITRKAEERAAMFGLKLLHPVAPGPLPWSITMGVPEPAP